MNRIKFISNFNYTGISIFLIKIIIGLSFFIAIIINALACTEQPDISIIHDVNIERPVKHGIKELTNVLEKKGISYQTINSPKKATGKSLLAVGLFEGEGVAAQLVQKSSQPIPKKAESFSILETPYRTNQVWAVNGVDDRGLMYDRRNFIKSTALTAGLAALPQFINMSFKMMIYYS